MMARIGTTKSITEQTRRVPNIVRKEVKIFQVAMDVPEYVTRRLQINGTGFSFENMSNLLAEFEQIFCKLFTVKIIDVCIRTLKHIKYSNGDGVISVPVPIRGR